MGRLNGLGVVVTGEKGGVRVEKEPCVDATYTHGHFQRKGYYAVHINFILKWCVSVCSGRRH